MVKLNRPVTGPDGVLRQPGQDYDDLSAETVENYRARGLLDEGKTSAEDLTAQNLRRAGVSQFVAGEDPNTGLVARGPVMAPTASGPADRGSAPGANDAGLSVQQNEAVTAEQTRINEETISPENRATIGPSVTTPVAEREGGEKMADAPRNKARNARSTK